MSEGASGLPITFLPPASTGERAGASRLKGRVVLVIGAGQDDRGLPPADDLIGNGRATSISAAVEGATVICADRAEDRAQATVDVAQAAVQRNGSAGSSVALQLDGADEQSMADAFAAIAQHHGRLDAVVANLGIGGPMWLANTSADDWDHVLAVNLRSHMLACKFGLQQMQPGGSIVLVSSIAGIRPGSRIPAYDTSKAALGGLMRHAAMEGQRRAIRVNVVAPGLMDTPLGRKATQGRPNRVTANMPLGRQGTAWEVANAVIFLISDDSAYITAQTIAVDGGRSVI
ncbi:MAG: SDR family NAD(P)-dependent oxidoreductase [Ilumatobacteraceae bacterium]